MKQFKIYGNPQGAYEAVKQGWSWPAFFFSAVWALVKKMWVIGGVVLTVGLGLFFLVVVAESAGVDTDALVLIWDILGFIICIIFGLKGNKWRESNLQSRGYEFKNTMTAANPEGAIALYIKEKQD